MCPREVVVGCNRSLEYAIFSGKSGQVRGFKAAIGRTTESPFDVSSGAHPALAARVRACFGALLLPHRAEPLVRMISAAWLAHERMHNREHEYEERCSEALLEALVGAVPRMGNILSFNRPNMGAVKNVRADPGEVDAGSRKPAIDAAATHPRRRATEAHAPKRRRRVDQRAAAKARSPRVAAGTRSGRYAPTARSTRFPK